MQVKFSWIIGLICLIGCLYQIYGITKLYLQFKVRHDVAYDYSNYVELPAIDIMIPMAFAYNWTKLLIEDPHDDLYCEQLKIKYGKLNTIGYNKTCEQYFMLYWLEQDPIALSHSLLATTRLINIRMDAFDLRKQVLVTSFGLLTNRHCKFTRYYNGLAIFMRILCLNETKPFSVNTDFVSLNDGVVASLTYSFGTYFGIRFSDGNDLPVYDPSKYFIITRKPNSFPHVTISFVKTVMSSLEYPYETNCRHYNKDKSISKCMDKYTLDQLTPYLYKTSVREWYELSDNLGFIGPTKENPRYDDNEFSQYTELAAYINCNQQAAATECEKKSYSVEGQILEETKGENGRIFIEPSSKVNIHLSVHPILPWSEYVIFIGSILGIWLGISIHYNIPKTLTYIITLVVRLKRSFELPPFIVSLWLDR
uniref:Uncharacterized protein n=1 Tax=Tetranychus urticae TaxID=32264 RepID=T1K3Y3_TETUR